jgi:nucleoside-diphosphate-sugar epimerase
MAGWASNARALKKTGLEYIRISNGLFSDYWGLPHIESNLWPLHWFLDIEKGLAAIPGTGDERFTVTYSKDFALVILKLLDVEERWPERLYLSGSDITLNELVAHAEKIRGIWSPHIILSPMRHLTNQQVRRSESFMTPLRNWNEEM